MFQYCFKYFTNSTSLARTELRPNKSDKQCNGISIVDHHGQFLIRPFRKFHISKKKYNKLSKKYKGTPVVANAFTSSEAARNVIIVSRALIGMLQEGKIIVY